MRRKSVLFVLSAGMMVTALFHARPAMATDPVGFTSTTIAKGQFVRPVAGLPLIANHYRLADSNGTVVAIARATGGRLAPDKVFVQPASSEASAAATDLLTPAEG